MLRTTLGHHAPGPDFQPHSMRLGREKKSPAISAGLGNTETVGFEPTDRLITDQTISSRSRYDHFDTSPDISCQIFNLERFCVALAIISGRLKKCNGFGKNKYSVEKCGVIKSGQHSLWAMFEGALKWNVPALSHKPDNSSCTV